jgi:hypothetical protein
MALLTRTSKFESSLSQQLAVPSPYKIPVPSPPPHQSPFSESDLQCSLPHAIATYKVNVQMIHTNVTCIVHGAGKVKSDKHTTSVQESTLEPLWDPAERFNCTEILGTTESAVVRFKVWDKDMGRDEFIGTADLPLLNLLAVPGCLPRTTHMQHFYVELLCKDLCVCYIHASHARTRHESRQELNLTDRRGEPLNRAGKHAGQPRLLVSVQVRTLSLSQCVCICRHFTVKPTRLTKHEPMRS